MPPTPAYVFRKEGDTENPHLARLHGLGITRGFDVMHRKNPETLLTILCEGARRDGDSGISGIRQVTYRGFIIPEFEAGVRNWRFHDGRMTSIPVYTTVTADHTSEKLLKVAHGLNNSIAGETYKIIAEGAATPTPPKVPTGLIDEQQSYYIVNKTANDFQLSLTVGGAAEAFTDNGAGTLRVYRANKGFDDPSQGRPEFFPDLNFTLSGIAYVELRVPTRFVEDFNPDDLRIILRGKKLHDFTFDADDIVTLSAPEIDSENNALEVLDFYINDAQIPTSYVHLGVNVPRFRGSYFEQLKDRCDEVIDWAEGGGVEAAMEFLTFVGTAMTVTPETGGLVKDNPAGHSAAIGRAILVAEQNFSLECTITAAQLKFGFHTNNTDDNSPQPMFLCAPDHRMYKTDAGVNTQIGTWEVGDRLKLVVTDRVMKWYQNNVPLFLPDFTLPAVTVYPFVHGSANSNMSVSQTLFSPSAVTTREIKRHTAHVVYPQATYVQDAVDGVMRRAPGMKLQDVNGAIKPLTDLERATAFLFKYDPQDSVASNILPDGCQMHRTPPESRVNFYRALIRDSDDVFLKQAPIDEDRPLLRQTPGVGLKDSGLMSYGVMNQSEGSRILKYQARERSDAIIFSSLEGFFESYVAAQGDYIEIADEVPGYDISDPVLFIVNEEQSDMSNVPTRKFLVQITATDLYSDTDHGVLVPHVPELPVSHLRPAPPIDDLTLSQTIEQLPAGEWVYSLTGVVEFVPYVGQRARVWHRRPTSEVKETFYVDVDNTFLCGNHGFAIDDMLVFLEKDAPLNAQINVVGRIYYVIAATLNAYQISLTQGGALYDAGADLLCRVHRVGAYQPTQIMLVPNTSNEATFEIAPTPVGLHSIVVVTENAIGASFPFAAHDPYHFEIAVEQIVPLPPSYLRGLWDGMQVVFQFAPSPSSFVTGYQITDENNRIIRNYTESLLWTEPLTQNVMSRRVYAVSNLGARSTDYAEIRFSIPPTADWVNLIGAAINSGGDFIKTVGTGWDNCSGIIDRAILTETVPARVQYAIDTEGQFKLFGLSKIQNPTARTDILFGLYFLDDGTIQAFWQDGGIQQLFIGTYVYGQKYFLKITPNPVPSLGAEIAIYRLEERPNGEVGEVLLHTFDPTLDHFGPWYVAVLLYTQGTRFAPYFELEGDLVDATGERADFDNTSSAAVTYSPTTGNIDSTGGGEYATTTMKVISGYGNDGLDPNSYQDGAVELSGDGTVECDFYLGVSAWPFPFGMEFLDISFLPTGEVKIFNLGGEVAYLGFYAPSERWSVGRENQFAVVRRDGIIVYLADWGATDWKTRDLYLSANFLSAGRISNILVRATEATTIDASSNVVPARNTLENAQVGKNKVPDIPRFVLDAPVEGEVLTFDPDLNLINVPISSLVPDLAIGDPITGGGSHQVLFQDVSENLASVGGFRYNPAVEFRVNVNTGAHHQFRINNVDKLSLDATDLVLGEDVNLKLANTTAATGGVPSQSSPYILLEGRGWYSGVSNTEAVRLVVRPNDPLASGAGSVNFGIDFYAGPANGWQSSFEYGVSPIGYGLGTRIKFGHPGVAAWGGLMDVTYDGIFGFFTTSGVLAGLQPGYFSWPGASALGYQSIRRSGSYGTTMQSAYGDPIGIKNPEAGFGASFSYIEPVLSIGHSAYGSAQLHIISTTEQLRAGYNSSNYFKLEVDSNGEVYLDAIGAGGKLHMAAPTHFFTGSGGSSWLPYSDGNNYLSALSTIFRDNADATFFTVAPTLLTLVNSVNFAFGTGAGTKFGTGITQKMGWWNATPKAQVGYGDVANYTVRRDFDPTVNTLSEFIDFMCTFWSDMQEYGFFGIP